MEATDWIILLEQFIVKNGGHGGRVRMETMSL